MNGCKLIVHTAEGKSSYFWFCLFPSSCGFPKEKHVCSEISQGCCAVRPPYLWFISQMGPLPPLLSPSVCFLPSDSTSPPLPPFPPLLFKLMFLSSILLCPVLYSSCSIFSSCLSFSDVFNLYLFIHPLLLVLPQLILISSSLHRYLYIP